MSNRYNSAMISISYKNNDNGSLPCCSPVSGRSVAPAVPMPPVVQRGADVPWATAIGLSDGPLREEIDVELELPSSLVHQKGATKIQEVQS